MRLASATKSSFDAINITARWAIYDAKMYATCCGLKNWSTTICGVHLYTICEMFKINSLQTVTMEYSARVTRWGTGPETIH